MVTREMKQKDVVDELKERTGFYKYHIQSVLDALEEIVIENMNLATYDNPSEITLFHGWRVGAKKTPERPSYDPRDRTEIITPAKLIPQCRFKQSFKNKINVWTQASKEDEVLCDE